jgi:hypothetical protein
VSRRHNLRLIKRHWSYTAAELAATLNVTITTVRIWTGAGLRPIPGTRPYLYTAADIVTFLKNREQPRQPLGPGEIYSVAARAPRVPAGGVVEIVPRSPTSADLVGICPDTGRRIYRRIRLAMLAEVLGPLKVRFGDDKAPISSSRVSPRVERSEEVAT